jgi:hypothetical protein
MLNPLDKQLSETLGTYKITSERIFNMDEKGVMLGIMTKAKVIA